MNTWTSEELFDIAMEGLTEQKKLGKEADKAIFISMSPEALYQIACAFRDLEEQASETTKIISDLGVESGRYN